MRISTLGLLILFAGLSRAMPQANAAATAAMPLTLERALALAQANEPQLAAALAERGATALERSSARAALLPTINFHSQAIYTKPNGVPASRIGQTTGADSPAFIANNAIREYAMQGLVDEKLGFNQLAAIRLATATALRAEAEAEVVRRGLVVVVTTLFFGLQHATEKAAIAREALLEANHFVDLAQKREQAREVAHADVLKAQLQQQQRERDAAEARLETTRARLELGVLLFADPSTDFTPQIPSLPPAMPDRAAIATLAKANSAEIRSAVASLQLAQAETFTSKAALSPGLALNYTYGIDATNFGVNGPDGIRNLGYSASATLDLPVWDWLSSERRIKASRLRETGARAALTATQRHLLANLEEFYAEAELAAQQLRSLDTSVLTARESLRLTNLRYIDGESTALEVVDSQSTLISAETAQIDGQLRYQVARAQLQTLTGSLP